MLQNLFNYDNPVWRFIGKFGDLIVLNILWTICSIPIFTIGASTTALYYCTLKMVRNEENGTIRSFFKSFKENFKQSTIIWMIMLVTAVVLLFDFYFFKNVIGMNATVKLVMTTLIMAVLFLWIFIFTYVFPIQSRFYNPVKKTFLNAFYMSIRHLGKTVLLIFSDVVLVAFAVFSLFYIPQISVLFILFGIPLWVWVNSYILEPVLEKYMPGETRTNDGSIRPLFAEDDEEKDRALESLRKDLDRVERMNKGEDPEEQE